MKVSRVDTGPAFELKYGKDCACGERMGEGTLVRYRNGKIEHVRCEDVHLMSQTPEQIREKRCGRCFMVHGAGACDR